MDGTFDLNSKTQICGVLMKKPFGHQSNKWSKRFFVVKDGYLLYYAENERKEMDKRKMFNIHPKGVLPLGDCVIEPCTEPGHIFSINIRNDDFPLNTVILAAETDWEREKWMNAIQKAKRITWSNALLGQEMIQNLENQGLSLAQEKQTYRDKFQNEAIALVDEKEKREQLEVVHNELEKEKRKLEDFLEQLQEEQIDLKKELSETGSALKKLEADRDETKLKSSQLEEQLQRLAQEKETTIEKLSERENLTRQLSEENENLSQTTNQLNKRLSAIEHETSKLMEEKYDAEKRLRTYEERARMLEEEKVQIAEHADELQTSIKDLREQKSVTENELREEVIARLDTERRLQNAEAELSNLENKLKQDGTKYSDNDKEEMIINVTKLKEFFENLAQEAKIDDKKPILMQTTYTARKSFIVRSKSKRYQEKRRKRVQSMKSQSDDDLSRSHHSTSTLAAPDNNNVSRTTNALETLLLNTVETGETKSTRNRTDDTTGESGTKSKERYIEQSSKGDGSRVQQQQVGEVETDARIGGRRIPEQLLLRSNSSDLADSSTISKSNGRESGEARHRSGEIRVMRRSESMEKAKDNQFTSLERPRSSESKSGHSKVKVSRQTSADSTASTDPKESKKSKSDEKKKSDSPKKTKSPKKHSKPKPR